MATFHQIDATVFDELQPLLAGTLLLPKDEDYHQACQIWNGNLSKHPYAVVRCINTEDVVHTIRWARSQDLPLSVRGGGHDFAGRAICDNGIILDFSRMKGVSIDTDAQRASVQGGTLVSDLVQKAQKHGLITSTGIVAGVGITGLTLGGGYGPLAGKWGLVADNLLSAQVVTADGDLINASPTEHADLFWGLRGGGGNFGAIVSLEYRLYPLTEVLAGWLLYPLHQAKEILHFYSDFIRTAPDELTIHAGFFSMPDGTPVLFLSPTYSGSLQEGEHILKPLRTFGTPIADQIQPTPYETLINAINPLVPKGRGYFIETRTVDVLRTETIESLIASAQNFSSPFSAISLHHFHGAASRVAPSETAFALRQDHITIELSAAWELQNPADNQKHIEWTKRSSRALEPYALAWSYINLLGEEEQQRVPHAFGANYARLLQVKQTYDPNDVFHSTVGHIVLEKE